MEAFEFPSIATLFCKAKNANQIFETPFDQLFFDFA